MNRLKQLRIEKNLKQSDVAKIFNCTQQMISRYEKSRTCIPSTLEEKFAIFYSCSIDYLRGLTNIRNPKEYDNILLCFSNLGIIKEGQEISPEPLILLKELINTNKSFFEHLTNPQNHLVSM